MEIGLFRMINLVENCLINMCRTISLNISLSEIFSSLPQDTNTDKIKSE